MVTKRIGFPTLLYLCDRCHKSRNESYQPDAGRGRPDYSKGAFKIKQDGWMVVKEDKTFKHYCQHCKDIVLFGDEKTS